MAERDRDMQPPRMDSPDSCGSCTAFNDNLCPAITDAIAAEGVQGEIAEDETAQARRAIWREGESVARVPVICQGWAATALTMSDGRRQILSFLLPGDLVSAVLIFEPSSQYLIEAITDVHYRTFPRDALQGALRRQPHLFALISKMWADEMARTDLLAIDLGRRGAAERIASLILALADRLARRGMMLGQTMDFPLRQHHIADAVGLTVVHVGNVLAEFRRAGMVEITDRSLTIADPAGLRRIAAMS